MNETLTPKSDNVKLYELQGLSALIVSSLMLQDMMSLDLSARDGADRFKVCVDVVAAILKPALETKPGDCIPMPFEW